VIVLQPAETGSAAGVECLLQASYPGCSLSSRSVAAIRFGERVRQLRLEKRLGQRALAEVFCVRYTDISRIENEKLDFGDYPSEELILRLAEALEVDAEELLILAQKIPARISEGELERPDPFCKLAALDDDTLDEVMRQVERR